MNKHMNTLRTAWLTAAIVLGMADAAAQRTVIVGDMNGDGTLTVADVAILASTVTGATPQQTLNVTEEATPDVPTVTHDWVDLGLPSGTLWATANVGADAPESYGHYIAWGETTPRSTYSWGNYELCEGYSNTLKRYCNDHDYGYADNIAALQPADDAATAAWGSEWCMPTREQFEELFDNSHTATSTRVLNGVDGYVIKSRSNEVEIFLPAAGYMTGAKVEDEGLNATYWSAAVSTVYPDRAWASEATLLPNASLKTSAAARYTGRPVRPVRRDPRK